MKIQIALLFFSVLLIFLGFCIGQAAQKIENQFVVQYAIMLENENSKLNKEKQTLLLKCQ